jgi:DNA-binding LacI/PurR family transcriptional regulator
LRIDPRSVDPHLEMQVTAGGGTSAPDSGDDLSGEHGLPDGDERRTRRELVRYGEWTAAGGESGFRSLMTGGGSSRPTAVIAGNTLIAAGVLSAAAAMALAVPSDMAVAGIHDSWLADYLVPSLTTISLPLRQVGSQAVRILLGDAIVERDVVVTTPAPKLHRRAST